MEDEMVDNHFVLLSFWCNFFLFYFNPKKN